MRDYVMNTWGLGINWEIIQELFWPILGLPRLFQFFPKDFLG